jgi:hypothetical protein
LCISKNKILSTYSNWYYNPCDNLTLNENIKKSHESFISYTNRILPENLKILKNCYVDIVYEKNIID